MYQTGPLFKAGKPFGSVHEPPVTVHGPPSVCEVAQRWLLTLRYLTHPALMYYPNQSIPLCLHDLAAELARGVEFQLLRSVQGEVNVYLGEVCGHAAPSDYPGGSGPRFP